MLTLMLVVIATPAFNVDLWEGDPSRDAASLPDNVISFTSMHLVKYVLTMMLWITFTSKIGLIKIIFAIFVCKCSRAKTMFLAACSYFDS